MSWVGKGGGLAMEFPWAWNIFKKFLDKLMQRENDFRRRSFLLKFYISLEVVPIKT